MKILNKIYKFFYKKYKKYLNDDEIMEELFKLIDEKLSDIKIKKIANKIVSEIFDNILSEYP